MSATDDVLTEDEIYIAILYLNETWLGPPTNFNFFLDDLLLQDWVNETHCVYF